MRVLLVGDANSIFLLDYTKWMKKVLDIEIHVYSIYPLTISPASLPYDRVYEATYENTLWPKIKYVRAVLYPFILNYEFVQALKKNKIKYDIIDFHWMIAAWVLTPNYFFKYTSNIIATFWGAEWDNLHLLLSNKLYRIFLRDFLQKARYVVSTTDHAKESLAKINPMVNTKYRYAYFGSEPLTCLEALIEKESKEESKEIMGLDPIKLSVVIGYSGKQAHNQLSIIETLKKSQHYKQLRNKIELIAPMTYGSNSVYVDLVENALEKSGFSYKVFKGYFSTDGVARLRNSTDIILQLASSDAVSRSILEFLIAGAVMISGSWINYQYFKNEGFLFTEINEFENFPEVLIDIIRNFPTEKDRATSNQKNGKGKYSWQDCIGAWKENYEACCR